jgi:RNA polymerase sigma-70 factor (ECF subfamily)
MAETVAPVAQQNALSDSPLASFGEFFETEHVRLFRALAVVLGDRREAEDLMQDAFIRLFERWDRVEALEDPVGYLYRTAMNLVRMRARRARATARRIVERWRWPSGDALRDVEERDRLDRALSRLTVRQRAALVLTGVYGFTSEEAGRILDVSPVTVRRLAGIARMKLRGSLEEIDA